jgi:ABC-type microcin C transport system duplicated ATPase subunit YejF
MLFPDIPMDETTRSLVSFWDDATTNLGIAVRDSADAKRRVAEIDLELARLETLALVGATGSNETARKAAYKAELQANPVVERLNQERIQKQYETEEAAGRATVWRQKCRMVDALVALRQHTG